MVLGVFNVSFLSVTDFPLLRIGLRTKWPCPIEAPSLWVIDSRADGYIVAGLCLSHGSSLQVDARMHSRRTSDIGRRGKRHRARL
jgi:hypothetical protein